MIAGRHWGTGAGFLSAIRGARGLPFEGKKVKGPVYCTRRKAPKTAKGVTLTGRKAPDDT